MKQITVVSTLLLILITWIGCDSSPANKTATPTPSTPPAAAAPSKSNLVAAPSISPAELEKRKKRLTELRSHFFISTDEFDHTQTVRHKSFSKYMNGNGTTIEARINDGHIWVESQYVSDDWIFHDAFTVKIGDDQHSADGRTQREVVEGVCETVSPNSSDSESIARFIASTDKEPVRVRLHGKFYKDFTLRPAHQKAIAETVEYFDLTKAD